MAMRYWSPNDPHCILDKWVLRFTWILVVLKRLIDMLVLIGGNIHEVLAASIMRYTLVKLLKRLITLKLF